MNGRWKRVVGVTLALGWVSVVIAVCVGALWFVLMRFYGA